MTQPANPTPDSAIDNDVTPGTKAVNWTAFYTALDNLTVSIPETSPGEPVDLWGLRELFSRVQRNRDTTDRAARKLLRLIGETKRQVCIKEHELTIQKAELLDEPLLNDLKLSDVRRRARVQTLTAGAANVVGMIRSRLAQYETALDAVKFTLATLETAKESLNAIQRLALAEVSPRPGTFSHHQPRR